MSNTVFRQIHEGLQEALDVVEGRAAPHAVHVSDHLDVKAIRRGTGLSQRDFAFAYGFGLDQLKQWEQGRASPVKPLRAYLTLIQADPEGVKAALRAQDPTFQGSQRKATDTEKPHRIAG